MPGAVAKGASERRKMALPLKTTRDDVQKVVNYFKTKPTGATLTEAQAALNKQLFDRRKVSAYRAWGVLSKDGDRYKLTPRAWDFARKPDTERDFYRQILDSNTAYRSAIEWMYHQGFDSVTVVDIAAHWHEHHASALGAEAKDDSIRDNAISFFHLCEGAGLGKLVIGRGGHPTRLTIDRDELKRYIEAGPSAPPWTEEAEKVTEEEAAEEEATEGDESDRAEVDAEDSTVPQPESPPAPVVAEPLRVFIAHGKNMEIVEQVQTMLGLSDIENEVAEEEETAAIPVPDKVFSAMKRCRAGIICVSVDEGHKADDSSYSVNENVLIEIGAAFVLYDRRVVLLWDKRLPVPSNLQGLYRCEYEGDELTWSAGMKLMKAIQGFKK
jgi:hypothetical protein